MSSIGTDYIFRKPVAHPDDQGAPPPIYSRSTADGMLIERNVKIPLRDRVKIYADIFRPISEEPAPPLIGWTPFGKHDPIKPQRYINCGIQPGHTTKYTAFEAPDPVYWVSQGYAVIIVDVRGMWHSPGDATYVSPEQAEDFYDVIEWAGVQPWSNGKVGLSGVSYLTIMQWRVAELHPPHLAAINLWEGWTDTYREVARHGGIPESWFWPQLLPKRWCVGTERVEDLPAETIAHPLFDEFWERKKAQLAKITTPAFVVASWCDHGLHTRGTLEGFKQLASEEKWLDVHSSKKWAHYYEPENLARARTFFDHFLKGQKNDLEDWPKVRLVLRNGNSRDRIITAKEWPIAQTRYTKLFLDLTQKSLRYDQAERETDARYDPIYGSKGAESLELSHIFRETTDLVGHMKLKLWVSVEGADDMDLFVGIRKYDINGNEVFFPFYAQFDDGPVALGWLRVSHRELDPEKSTEYQPYLKHKREQKLSAGEIVPVEIEIWPSSTRFETGEALHLVIQGSDMKKYPKEAAPVYARHEDTVNAGLHVIHAGGKYDSHLLVPMLPSSQ